MRERRCFGILLVMMLFGCKSKADEDYAKGVTELQAGRLPEARSAFEAAKSNAKAADELTKIDEKITAALKSKLVGHETDMSECGDFSKRVTAVESSTVKQAAPAAEAFGQWLVTANVRGTCVGISCVGISTSACAALNKPNQTKPFDVDFRATLATTKLGDVSVGSLELEKKKITAP